MTGAQRSKIEPEPDYKIHPDTFADLVYMLRTARENYHCNRPPRASGALIVTPAQAHIIAGVSAPYPSPSCDEVGCDIVDGHCVRCIHAEQAAIALAARTGLNVYGSVMYSVNKPCHNCTKAIITAGITKVVYIHAVYDEDRTTEILKAAGIEMLHTTDEEIRENARLIDWDASNAAVGIIDTKDEVDKLLDGLSEGLEG